MSNSQLTSEELTSPSPTRTRVARLLSPLSPLYFADGRIGWKIFFQRCWFLAKKALVPIAQSWVLVIVACVLGIIAGYLLREARYNEPVVEAVSFNIHQNPFKLRTLTNSEDSVERNTSRNVPLSLVIPCMSDDFVQLRMLLVSLANQTVYPHETILVLNLPEKSFNGSLLWEWETGIESKRGSTRVRRPDQRKKDSIPTLESPITPYDNQFFNNVPPLKASETNISDFMYFEDAIDYIEEALPTIQEAIESIPSLRVYIRGGRHYAGDNRIFGASKARLDSEVISFFDCDDYLHPDRTKILYDLFDETPDLDAVIHSFQGIPITQWRRRMTEFLGSQKLPLGFYSDQKFDYTYEELRTILNTKIGLPDGTTEPNSGPGSRLWWFPRDMGLHKLSGHATPHNGWVTVRKHILKEVPYPDTPTGQDSLYNWRLMKAGKNFNYYPVRLGAYIRPR